MSKSRLEYLMIHECKVYDKNDNVLAQIEDTNISLEPGMLFNFEKLFESGEKATHFSLKLHDPNTN